MNVLDRLDLLAFRLRHPTARRCPNCKLNWERLQDGLCHDCWAEAVWTAADEHPDFADATNEEEN